MNAEAADETTCKIAGVRTSEAAGDAEQVERRKR